MEMTGTHLVNKENSAKLLSPSEKEWTHSLKKKKNFFFLIEHPVCARQCTRSLGYTGGQNKIPALVELNSPATTARLKLLLVGSVCGGCLCCPSQEVMASGQSRLVHTLLSPSVHSPQPARGRSGEPLSEETCWN